MPVYHARSITVRLATLPLGETTTSDVVLKKGEVAKRQSEAAEKKLIGSRYLNEQCVLFSGDRDGFELNWLGNAPFMQTQIRSGFSQSQGLFTGEHDQRHGSSGQNRIQALALHVKLSDKAFISGFNGKTHLKIEVLFNGQLSTCSLIHTNDIRSGTKSLHQVFAGSRADFLTERPWVLLPPHTNPDGRTRRFRKTITPTERWREISAAIQKEVEERGTDKSGESPPSAAFLQALATMEMPESVHTMQKPGGRKFGVMDIIITAGYGNKTTTGTNYLKGPQRLRDANFAVRAEIGSDDEVAAAELVDLQDVTNKTAKEMPAGGIGHETNDGESDVLDEPPQKRRALCSLEGLPQQPSKRFDFHSLFLSRQIPVLPSPTRGNFQSTLSLTVGTVSPRCPSPEYRSDGHKEPLPANDHNRTYNLTYDSNHVQECKSDAPRIYQEYYYLPPESDQDALRAGSANPALAWVPPSRSQNAYGLNGVSSIAGSPIVSSPVPHFQDSQTPPPPQPTCLNRVDVLNASTRPEPSTPSVAPTALMLPTPPEWSLMSTATTSPYQYPMSFQQPPQLNSYSYRPTFSTFPPCMPPNGLPNLPPQMPLLHTLSGASFTTPIMSSHLIQPCGPMPPTAMFSVPLKPGRNASPNKGVARSKLDVFSNIVTLSRLIITGQDGKSIVDHTWNTPQRIRASTGVRTLKKDRKEKSALQPNQGDTSDWTCERSDELKKGSPIASRATTPSNVPQTGSVEKQAAQERRDSAVKFSREVRLPYLRRHQGPPKGVPPVDPRIDLPDSIAPFEPAPVLATITSNLVLTPARKPESKLPVRPKVSQRRTFSGNPLPGIQGSKAATFLFDDPEEVLREAAKMRRSRSPTKPAATPVVLPATPTAQEEPKADRVIQSSSSSLSSVPSSPLSEKLADVVNTADAASNQIPQVDGSPERILPAASLRKLLIQSPKKPSFATPMLHCPGRLNPQRPISPKMKKRKVSQLSLTRPLRSLDRLKTVDNPPLNDDCIIAFAESADKQEERGVLRQIKGERQGMFKEEYVVLAVRFFVAGD